MAPSGIGISCGTKYCLFASEQLLKQKQNERLHCPHWTSLVQRNSFSCKVWTIGSACTSIYCSPSKCERRDVIVRSVGLPIQSALAEPSHVTAEDTGFVNSLDRAPETTLPADFKGVPLVYRPYLQFVWDSLMDRKLAPQDEPMPAGFQYQYGVKGKRCAEVHSWLLRASRLRRVRMTYFAGDTCQAFNSVFYPEHKYDLPLLGIDLLAFENGKIVWIIDFQPLWHSPEYREAHTCELAETYESVSAICGHMSRRHFEPAHFLSDKMLYFHSRLGHDEPALQVPDGQLYVAYTKYVEQYLRQLERAEALVDDSAVAAVAEAQRAFDDYFAQRDPAIGLLNTFFGKEWAHRYTHEFLFTGANDATPLPEG